MSRRKPCEKKQHTGSLFGEAVDVKPGLSLPGLTQVPTPVPFGMFLQTTGDERYFHVDVYYGKGDKDQKSIMSVPATSDIVHISVSRILDSQERKDMATDTMKRLLDAMKTVSGFDYKWADVAYKNVYSCGWPERSTYDYAFDLGEKHTPVSLEVWNRDIFPKMWVDGTSVNENYDFNFKGSSDSYKWTLTSDTPAENTKRIKVTLNKSTS